MLAVYDICRSDLHKFAGLTRGTDDTPPLAEGNHIHYTAIAGTDPKGTVDANSTLATTLFAEFDKYSADSDPPSIRIPTATVEFEGVNGMVEKTIMGKAYNLPWYDEALENEKKVEQKEV